jgi:hypothetical protein
MQLCPIRQDVHELHCALPDLVHQWDLDEPTGIELRLIDADAATY